MPVLGRWQNCGNKPRCVSAAWVCIGRCESLSWHHPKAPVTPGSFLGKKFPLPLGYTCFVTVLSSGARRTAWNTVDNQLFRLQKQGGSASFSDVAKFPLEQLQENKGLPDSIDALHKEVRVWERGAGEGWGGGRTRLQFSVRGLGAGGPVSGGW